MSPNTHKQKPRIPEWYAGRTILVTGGTGFMGKVLLEKLLRSCPDLERILVLVRDKRGTDSRSRIKQMLQLPLFDRLRSENPDVMGKLCVLSGDITKPNLGLSVEDRTMTQKAVSVVFHCAASVYMNKSLKTAVESNLMSTIRIVDLAEGMTQLTALVHLSTAFCVCEEEVVEEKLYPPPAPPDSILYLVKSMKDEDLEAVTNKLLGAHPNTYTYTKRLAESVVAEKGTSIHAAIARPSIVLPSCREPMPGWVDSFNGPVGLFAGSGKGLMRSMMVNENYHAELCPVDIAVNALITIAWVLGNEKPDGVPVYNLTQGKFKRITWGEVHDIIQELSVTYPLENVFWYPGFRTNTNRLAHLLNIIFLHYLPACLVDTALVFTGKKRFLVNVQRKIGLGMASLEYFFLREWNFLIDSSADLQNHLRDEDRDCFSMRVDNQLTVMEYSKNALLGTRQYCLKEPLSSLPKARRRVNRLFYLDTAVQWLKTIICLSLVYYFLTWTLDTVTFYFFNL